MTVGLLQLRGGDAPAGGLFNLTTEDGLSNLTTEDGLSVLQTSTPVLDWPGLPAGNNPVGHAATPAAIPSNWPGGTWPGAWPGSFTGGSAISTAAYAAANPTKWVSGTPGNPKIIAFVDFDSAGLPNSISDDGADHSGAHSLNNVTFVGCRFQSAAVGPAYNVECFKNGSSNIAFLYCSMTPRRTAGPYFSKVASPGVLDVSQPGSWPSASVGTGLADGGGGVAPILPDAGVGTYQTPYLSSATNCLAIGTNFGTYMIVDHCDMWGGAYAISGAAGSTPTLITDNWMHDNRFPIPPYWDSAFSYGSFVYVTDSSNGHVYISTAGTTVGLAPHLDGTHWNDINPGAGGNDHGEILGFSQGNLAPPWNWTIRHNTMATLGNTGVIVWQSTDSHYQNIAMINNYFSGTHWVTDFGTLANNATGFVPNTGWTIKDNVFATDLSYGTGGFLYDTDPTGANPNPQHHYDQFSNVGAFAGANNIWKGNKIRIHPLDTWSGIDHALDGQFIIPRAWVSAGIGSGFYEFSTNDWLSFPGQFNNPVGHAAAPGWPGNFTNAAQGYPSPVVIGDGTGGTLHLVSGQTYSFLDIAPGAFDLGNVPNSTGRVGDPAVTGVTFVGCRFTAAGQSVPSIANVNQYQTGSGLLFKYCTFAPTPVAMFPALAAPNPIPARAWPSTSVGQGFKVNDSVYQTPWLSACRDCINIAVAPGTLVRLEHCDMWGHSAFIGVSGQNWQRGVRSATVNGTIEIVDCWLHDNLLPSAPTWDASTNYPIGSYASGTDFNNYKATAASGPANGGAQGPPDTSPGGKWIFWSTYAHSNGVMPTNVNGMSNILVEHCTISGLGNTVGCNAGHNWTVGTFWNASTPYTTGNEALSVDGYHYTAARPNTGVDPTGDTHTLDWTQDGFNHDDNVIFRRNFISGVWFSGTVDLGYGNSNSKGMIFEDNILSNAVMWNHLCYTSNPISNGGPYTPTFAAEFTASPTNSWRRNTYNVWPGSASWDATNAGKNGQFVWPDGTINTTDWPN